MDEEFTLLDADSGGRISALKERVPTNPSL
jgi:hypothetical protein